MIGFFIIPFSLFILISFFLTVVIVLHDFVSYFMKSLWKVSAEWPIEGVKPRQN